MVILDLFTNIYCTCIVMITIHRDKKHVYNNSVIINTIQWDYTIH